MFKLLSLSSAKDYAGWKHNVGMAGLEWFKPLRGVLRIMDGDLYKNNKKGYMASSPSQNYYIRQPHAPLLMSRRDLVWSGLYIQEDPPLPRERPASRWQTHAVSGESYGSSRSGSAP